MDTIVEVNRERMREALTGQGWTVRGLADAAGTTRAMTHNVMKYAQGRHTTNLGKHIRADNAQRIAAALGEPYPELFRHTNGDPICQ